MEKSNPAFIENIRRECQI